MEASGEKQFVIKGEQKKFDTAEHVEQALESQGHAKQLNLSQAESLTLSGNSYGFEACEFVAQQLARQDTPFLSRIDFSNIFVSRLRAELPRSL